MSVENDVRAIVILGIGQIPEVGGIVGGLVGILWPASKEDIWGQIKDKVEKLINQKIADYEYQQVQESLTGLNNVLADYLSALKTSQDNPTYISEKYNVALGHFEASQPHFMSKSYEVLLLPLMAQMANMHLALLQDGVLYGAEWNWTPATVDHIQDLLTEQVALYGDWANEWYDKGFDEQKIPRDDTGLSKSAWTKRNNYVRGMTLGVLDLAFHWPYFDKANQPTPEVPKQTREIFSDPKGTANDNKIVMTTGVWAPLRELSIYGYDRIDAVQQGFEGGPLFPRRGNTSGGQNVPPHGWNGKISLSNPVTKVSGLSGDILNAMWLGFQDGTQTNKCGGNYAGGNSFTFEYSGQVLSSVYVTGKNHFYGSAECGIFGFRFPDSY